MRFLSVACKNHDENIYMGPFNRCQVNDKRRHIFKSLFRIVELNKMSGVKTSFKNII